MNSITRMYLVSEDQYKRNVLRPSTTRKMMNKNLPIDTKVKFINNLINRKPDNYWVPNSFNPGGFDQSIDQTTNQSIDQTIDQPADQNSQSTSEQEQSSYESLPYQSLPQNELMGEPVNESKVEDSTLIVAGPSTSTPVQPKRSFPKTPYSEQPTQKVLPTSSQKKKQKQQLELVLRSRKDLINSKGQILDDSGKVINNSDVTRMVEYLRKTHSGPNAKAPNGYNAVIYYFLHNRIDISSLTINKKAKSSLGLQETLKSPYKLTTWKQLLKK